MLKIEVSAQNEVFKTLFLTTGWPKKNLPGIVFFCVNNPRNAYK
jgi:hypothetical protein